MQARSGPEGSRKLRSPDFMTKAQDSGKVVSLTQPLLDVQPGYVDSIQLDEEKIYWMTFERGDKPSGFLKFGRNLEVQTKEENFPTIFFSA